MTRSQRIRLVVAAGLGLAALTVALFGAPLAAVLSWPNPDAANGASMEQSVASAYGTIAAAGRVSLASLVVAGLCFAYCLVALARWFIGAAPAKHIDAQPKLFGNAAAPSPTRRQSV